MIAMTPWVWVLVGISELIALPMIWSLWRSNDFLLFKLVFSCIALIPLFGPFFVLWINNYPAETSSMSRNRTLHGRAAYDHWREVFEEKDPGAKFRKWRVMLGRDSGEENV